MPVDLSESDWSLLFRRTAIDRAPAEVLEVVGKALIGSSVDVGVPRVLKFLHVDFRNGATSDDCTDV
jgi:hypothetical protein